MENTPNASEGIEQKKDDSDFKMNENNENNSFKGANGESRMTYENIVPVQEEEKDEKDDEEEKDEEEKEEEGGGKYDEQKTEQKVESKSEENDGDCDDCDDDGDESDSDELSSKEGDADEGEKRLMNPRMKTKAVSKAKSKAHSLNILYDVEKNGWKKGTDSPYMVLAKAFSTIENERGRIAKTIHLANAYRTFIAFSPQDLIFAVYLSIGRLAPDYHGVELGIGDMMLQKLICETTGKKLASLRSMMREVGDLGTVAMMSKQNMRTVFPPPPLTLKMVFKTLTQVALAGGQQSRDKKLSLMQKLLVSSKDVETLYLIRTLQVFILLPLFYFILFYLMPQSLSPSLIKNAFSLI
jgi:DNA ligase-1